MLSLAASAPEATALKEFLEVFFYLAGSVTALLVGWKQLRTTNVSKADFDKAIKEAHGRMNREKDERDTAVAERKKARDEEVAAMKAATSALREQIETEVAEMRRLVEAREKSGEDRANRINDRIDTLSKAVGEMPDRLFALIRNAKNL